MRWGPFPIKEWQKYRQPSDSLSDGRSPTYILVMNNKV